MAKCQVDLSQIYRLVIFSAAT